MNLTDDIAPSAAPARGIGYFTPVHVALPPWRTGMKLPRRRFLHLAAGAAALPAMSRIVRAQSYPSRPVRIVVGLAAGGGARPSEHAGAT
jgi:hypothetical protein